MHNTSHVCYNNLTNWKITSCRSMD